LQPAFIIRHILDQALADTNACELMRSTTIIAGERVVAQAQPVMNSQAITLCLICPIGLNYAWRLLLRATAHGTSLLSRTLVRWCLQARQSAVAERLERRRDSS